MVAAQRQRTLQPLHQPGTIQLNPVPIQYTGNYPFIRIKQGRGQKTPLTITQFHALPGAADRPFPGIGISDNPWMAKFQHSDCFGADNSYGILCTHRNLHSLF
jgi:hypothetical protein